MLISRKTTALILGVVSALSAAAIAQVQGQAQRGETLVIEEATVDWIQRSDVSARVDGVLEKLELGFGKLADREGAVIGSLHSKKAKLYVAKATIASLNKASKAKGEAEFLRASSVVDRNDEMLRRDRSIVSKEEQGKAIAEKSIAKALIDEAVENQTLAKAELRLAEEQLEEHTIRAPFRGVVYDVMKHPGEAVRTGDAIVRLGNLDKLRVFAYIPLDYKSRVKVGSQVLIRPRVNGVRPGGANPTDKGYPGVITFVDPQVQPVSETAIRVHAEFANSKQELEPGLKVSVTIFLEPGGGALLGSNAPTKPEAGFAPPEAPPITPAAVAAPELPSLPRR